MRAEESVITQPQFYSFASPKQKNYATKEIPLVDLTFKPVLWCLSPHIYRNLGHVTFQAARVICLLDCSALNYLVRDGQVVSSRLQGRHQCWCP